MEEHKVNENISVISGVSPMAPTTIKMKLPHVSGRILNITIKYTFYANKAIYEIPEEKFNLLEVKAYRIYQGKSKLWTYPINYKELEAMRQDLIADKDRRAHFYGGVEYEEHFEDTRLHYETKGDDDYFDCIEGEQQVMNLYYESDFD